MAGTPRRPTRPGRTVVRVNVTRLDMLLSGELLIEDLDDEEIARMQLRDKNGDFKGRPSSYVPRELALAFRQESYRRFQSAMGEMLPNALKAHREMLDSRHLAPGDAARLSAIKEVYERTFGKVAATSDVHLTVDKGKTFDDVLDEVLVDVEEDDELTQ